MKKESRCIVCFVNINKEDYVCKSCQKIDIENFGAYRMGLTSEEINHYIQIRSNKKNVSDLVKRFNKIAGCNTVAVSPDGKSLMYRHDVLRFSDILFGVTRTTYFD